MPDDWIERAVNKKKANERREQKEADLTSYVDQGADLYFNELSERLAIDAKRYGDRSECNIVVERNFPGKIVIRKPEFPHAISITAELKNRIVEVDYARTEDRQSSPLRQKMHYAVLARGPNELYVVSRESRDTRIDVPELSARILAPLTE
jgi:hypothetical protein